MVRTTEATVREDSTLAMGAPSLAALLRRARLPLVVVAVLVLVAVLSGAPARAAIDVVHKLAAADPAWVVAAAMLEIASFAGYVLLSWHVAGRATPRFDLTTAYRTTVAGAAATRLLPTAGAGGAALTLWVLRRAGLEREAAARTLLAFLVVLYGVFLLAVAAAGTAVALSGRPAVGALPAALAVAAMTVAVLLGRHANQHRSTTPDAVAGKVQGAARTLGLGVCDAAEVVRGRDPRLLGAVAWWGFDVAVLGAAVYAVGGSLPVGTLVLAYFLGQVANTLPAPGAASSGLAGVLIVLGVDPAVAVAAVLVYRAIAVWLPAPAGAVALGGLRRSVARWDAARRRPRAAAARCLISQRAGKMKGAQRGRSPCPQGFSVTHLEVPLAVEEKVEFEGEVVEALPSLMFRVKLDNGHEVLGHLAGKMRRFRIRVLPGDRVRVEVSPYDLSRGRITYRFK